VKTHLATDRRTGLLVELFEDDASFGADAVPADRDDTVEADEIEDDAARQGHRLAIIARTGAPWRDRNVVRIGGSENGDDVFLRARRDDEVGGDVLQLRLEARRIPVMVAALLLDDARVILLGNVAEGSTEGGEVHRISIRSSNSR
jgi:hypothetical protein